MPLNVGYESHVFIFFSQEPCQLRYDSRTWNELCFMYLISVEKYILSNYLWSYPEMQTIALL